MGGWENRTEVCKKPSLHQPSPTPNPVLREGTWPLKTVPAASKQFAVQSRQLRPRSAQTVRAV